MLLGGQFVHGNKAEALGFRFAFPTVYEALGDLFAHGGTSNGADGDGHRDSAYLRRHGGRYCLTTETLVNAPIDDVFPFFSMPKNLGVITPGHMSWEFLDDIPPEMAAGTVLNYRIRVGPIPMRWRTRIETWEPTASFSDVQERGPYRAWHHTHRFEARGDQTLMRDRILYTPPLGPLGWLANRIFIRGMLRDIFGFRSQAIRLRFGSCPNEDTHAAHHDGTD